ncbi:hypothetical protein PAMC26510_18875 [Caballeronia sordidicola]|uniref:Uncharacterized protein n=1 Tax=Caballeronia sordidicola TaxID=196367 RepID=A0A242MPT2_CABSO|nr:hypothetical protein PAMC26510_18875 [Caballeronia sordidicola]
MWHGGHGVISGSEWRSGPAAIWRRSAANASVPGNEDAGPPCG